MSNRQIIPVSSKNKTLLITAIERIDNFDPIELSWYCNLIVIFLSAHARQAHSRHFSVLHGLHHLPHLVKLGK